MERELKLRIVLVEPPSGVDFGLQKGHGNNYETVEKQRSKSGDLSFEFSVRIDEGANGQPNFLGPFTQGPAAVRFVYLDIGTYAGQTDTPWSRRLKIPLTGITWDLIDQAKVLEARVPGTGRDGGPTCASVKNFEGWKAAR
jgi:hypothetical protein